MRRARAIRGRRSATSRNHVTSQGTTEAPAPGSDAMTSRCPREIARRCGRQALLPSPDRQDGANFQA